jgi:C4-dicarboxylate transporter DctQ subunit
MRHHWGNQVLSKINKALNFFEEATTAFLFALAVVLAFAEVVLRYIFNDSLGSMELVIFSLIWASLIGASAGVRHGVHIHVEILVDRLPRRLAKTLALVGLAISAAFTAFLCIFGVQFVLFLLQRGQTTPEMRVIAWPFYSVIPLSTGLMTIRFCQEFYYLLSGKQEHPPTEVYGMDVDGKGAA